MLTVQDLRKSFGDFEAVKGVSFEVEKGESYGLLGPNGAGKSTSIHMVTGLFPPTSGEIRMKGIDVVKNPKQAQKWIGVVPQEIALYQSMSARENLKFWGRMYDLSGIELEKSVDQVLEIIGLTERAKDKVETFSGGMKRRVNIGAAILHKPELLIMDEPTVGIDPQSRNHILETVRHLNNEGMTIIYTSHYMEEVEYLCERIGIVDHGQLIASGTLSELRETIGDQSKVILTINKDESKMAGLAQSLTNLFPENDIQIQDQQIKVFHKEPQLILTDFIQSVTKTGVKITSVDIVEPNLESVFLHLTGRNLRD
ncbi:ATP-binding cassette domain-containing protein [Neobacillus sp. MM2021_6]|uniref:ABC transporter ATP-binding protein n=1 Tax=Bacillaceae TaxID=186817 RepID=UPI00140DD96A|nr:MULTISPECIES: ATP-binding cassette domain-containing protein [Bacillaceae]MBO0962118.1 ATP-binding cassette domain-containing protein [Neobacillus sp. MM2021_6]NHC20086.1 ATP-binding cassette domain-containing protein [Bacillus sp. MM2020_4]